MIPPGIIQKSSPYILSIPPNREKQLSPLFKKDNFEPTPVPVEHSSVRIAVPIQPSLLENNKPFPSNRIRHFPFSAVLLRQGSQGIPAEGPTTMFKKSGERHFQSSPVQYDPDCRRRQYHPSSTDLNAGVAQKLENPPTVKETKASLLNVVDTGPTTSRVPKPRLVESPPILVPPSRVRHKRMNSSTILAPESEFHNHSNCGEHVLPEFKNGTIAKKRYGNSWAPLSWRDATVNTGASY